MDLLFQQDEKTNPPTDLHDLQELQRFLTAHQGGMTANMVFKVHIANKNALVYNSTYVLFIQEVIAHR